ncbi:MAG TPA: kynureninase [Fimbriimonas sp.]|nr:kynureninase [Fimbriimonas sp.]
MGPDPVALDAADPLRRFRDEFALPPDLIYLDGNSLGPMPKRASAKMDDLLNRQWATRLVRGWGESWIDLPQRLGAKIASLIGAEPDEVLVCDSTSVNFFKLLKAALRYQTGRSKVVTEDAGFPTNAYVLQHCVWPDYLVRVASPDGISMPPELIERELDASVALLTLNHVTFKSGWLHDAKRLTAAAHDRGALVLLDLCHSVGVVPVKLDEWGVDLAVGCSYKYLNGGPGATAFLFVRRELQEKLMTPIPGWFGHERQFAMEPDYSPKPGVDRFLAGSPPIMSMTAMEAGIDLVAEAGVSAIRTKSIQLTDFLGELWREWLAPRGFVLRSPERSASRGSHISFGHPEALAIDRALIAEKNVIPDFRQPDNLRIGLAPLYTRFSDVFEAVQRIVQVVDSGVYEQYRGKESVVT